MLKNTLVSLFTAGTLFVVAQSAVAEAPKGSIYPNLAPAKEDLAKATPDIKIESVNEKFATDDAGADEIGSRFNRRAEGYLQS